MDRWLMVVAALLSFVLVAPAVAAQEGTPPAGADEGGIPDLAFTFAETPDFPAFEIVASEDGWEVPAEVAGGRVLASLQNDAGIEFLDAQLVMVPEGVTLDEVEQVFAEDPESGGEITALWIYDAFFPGGPVALAGGRGEAVVDLIPGEYAVVSTDPEVVGQIGVASFTVVEGQDPATAEEPAADVEVTEIDFAFELPEGIGAGPQVWQVTHAGDHPHMLVLQSSPEEVTAAQVDALLEFETSGTPTADLPDPSGWMPVAYVPLISTGVTTWVSFSVPEGYLIAACFVPDQTGMPHANLGMYAVAEVGA